MDETKAVHHLYDRLLREFRSAATADPEYQKLVAVIEEGFPRSPDRTDPAVRAYWKLRSELWADEDLAMYGARIIVPKSKRVEVLKSLHAAHAGVDRAKRRARSVVYWPGINSDIVNTVRACEKCQSSQPSLPKEPLLSDPHPSRVFEDVSADLFDFAGSKYLVYVDRLRERSTVDRWKGRDPTSADVIKVVRKNFRDLGVPVRFRSDGGPQFKSLEFAKFLDKWKVQHVMSTPHFPQSNGHAEAAAKAMKALISRSTSDGQLDSDEFAAAMLEYRNTPRAHGLSPAEILFGHPVRSLVPALRTAFAPRWREVEALPTRIAKETEKVKKSYDKNAKTLPPLNPGTTVRVQDPQSKQWSKRGTLVSTRIAMSVAEHGTHRDFKIRLENGRIYWRNRRYIRPCLPEATQCSAEHDESPPEQHESQQPRRSTRTRRPVERLTFG